jgi:hypothetical protein
LGRTPAGIVRRRGETALVHLGRVKPTRLWDRFLKIIWKWGTAICICRLELFFSEILNLLEIDAPEVSPPEVGALKIRPLKLSAREVRPRKVGPYKVGPLKISHQEVGARELGVPENSLPEASARTELS